MSNSPLRADLLASIGRLDADMHRLCSDILETVMLSRKALESSRALMRQADEVLNARPAGELMCKRVDRIADAA